MKDFLGAFLFAVGLGIFVKINTGMQEYMWYEWFIAGISMFAGLSFFISSQIESIRSDLKDLISRIEELEDAGQEVYNSDEF